MAEEEKPHNQDLAAITVTSKLSDFWPELPRMWFAQFEAVLAPQKQGDETKFNLVVSKLGKEALQQVSDLIYAKPDERTYEKLKKRLLDVYEESAERQFQKLVSEMDLGTQKPSQLLRKMRDLGRSTQVSDDALQRLWVSRLPSRVRAVLAVTKEDKLDDLAAIADTIMDSLRVGDVFAMSGSSDTPPPQPSTSTADVTSLSNQLMQMTIELKELRGEINAIRGRSFQRTGGQGYRSRSRSRTGNRPPMTPDDPRWLCRYHYKFGQHARSCEKPCNWKDYTTPPTPPSGN